MATVFTHALVGASIAGSARTGAPTCALGLVGAFLRGPALSILANEIAHVWLPTLALPAARHGVGRAERRAAP